VACPLDRCFLFLGLTVNCNLSTVNFYGADRPTKTRTHRPPHRPRLATATTASRHRHADAFVANYVPKGMDFILQSENGNARSSAPILSYPNRPRSINAGKEPSPNFPHFYFSSAILSP